MGYNTAGLKGYLCLKMLSSLTISTLPSSIFHYKVRKNLLTVLSRTQCCLHKTIFKINLKQDSIYQSNALRIQEQISQVMN
ncbi:hypothetical protein OIU79_029136 [Salix purpurea]|uniref:Uncharacterized protein n=1 Tax=Salix purpurea TaxID=77065 RepID=A0A9Q0ZV79_SALPP|nr:hypothetical protein OIU79_029136 [Salix purpurea]